MKSLAKIILSAYLSVAPSLQNPALAEPETTEKTQTMQTETKLVRLEISPSIEVQTEQKPLYEVPIEKKYLLILEECKRINAESVTQTRKVSGGLEESIEKYGFESITGIKNDVDKSCLDLILKKINNEILEQDIEKEEKKIAKEYQEKLQKTNVNSPINFTNEKTIKAQHERIKMDIIFYEHLLRANIKINPEAKIDYHSLITASFPQKEYEEIVYQQLNALNNVYDAMIDSRIGFRGWFAKGEINAIREVRRKQLIEEAKKNYIIPEIKQGQKAK